MQISSFGWTFFAPSRPLLADTWYSMSYLYFSPIGTIIAIVVGLLVSLLTGRHHWIRL